ncbi:prepilin peptidase [Parapedobacter sp. GCM10030251]|uniref:prepilin peptidase n=1 Tax=Parapedobacter sp. GCM10030251 TaxID=3273419 RepID=UPI003620B0B7
MVLWGLVIAVLAAIAWQDFKYRAIYTWMFPAAVALVTVQSIMLHTFSFTAVGINLLIIALQLALLNLLMYWRKGEWLMEGEQWMGWGDVAFFAVLIFCFSPVNFVVFYLTSLLLVLIGSLAIMVAGYKVGRIPLAGGQAALLAIVWLFDYSHWGRRLYMDIDLTRFVQ